MREPDPRVEELVARIADGVTIVHEQLPADLVELPEVQKLLGFARVTQVFADNVGGNPAERVAPDRIGPWQLLRLLGSGGMGDVWLGERRDGTVEHRVAIKRVRGASAAFAQRLLAERRILAKLSHPNIARFIDAGVDAAGAPWLALDYIDGETLNVWCERVRPSLSQRLQLFLAICAAVEHAHRHLVIHRDLKPTNVLIDSTSTPHLLDFGVAKLLDGSTNEVTTTAITPAYAAPEQLRGGEVSTATDVYALGLLLFRLIAGELPPTRLHGGVAQVLARLDEEETQRASATARMEPARVPYPAKDLEGDLDAIVSKAIRALPQARYGSVAELAADIRRHLQSRPVSARPPTSAYLFARWARRNALAVGLGSAAGLALLGGTTASLWQAARAEASALAARTEAQRAQRELQRAERISDFLSALFREQDPLSRSSGVEQSPSELLAQAATRAESELVSEPAVAAQLLRVLGESQLSLGDTERAKSSLMRAQALSIQSNNPLLGAEIEALLGQLALSDLRQDDAERLFAQALAVAQAHAGRESLEAARIHAKRALSLVWLGRFKEARESAEQADGVLATKLPSDDLERIEARALLGVILEQVRDDIPAEAAFRSAISAIELARGHDDARLIRALEGLGEIKRRAQQFEEARALLKRAVVIAERSYQSPHIKIAQSLTRLAAIERDAGDSPAAIVSLIQAETELPKSGEASVRAQLLATRGSTHLELGDSKRAEADLREALRLRRETGGLKTGLAWFTQAQLGEALMLGGKLTQAHALQSEAARELRTLLGPDAYQNALIAQRFAKTLEAQGDFLAASAQWRESARLIEKTYGLDHFGHLDMSSRLAAALTKIPKQRVEGLALADILLQRWGERKNDAATMERIQALQALR